MSLRPDLLAGLNSSQRRQREREDAELLMRAQNVTNVLVSREASKRDMELAGVPGFRASAITNNLRELRSDDKVDFIVAARVDLDHPIYFADNLFSDCADCGCRVQYRPAAPPGTRLCVCCAARRVREDPDFSEIKP